MCAHIYGICDVQEYCGVFSCVQVNISVFIFVSVCLYMAALRMKLFIRIKKSVTDVSKFLDLTDATVLQQACEELKVSIHCVRTH